MAEVLFELLTEIVEGEWDNHGGTMGSEATLPGHENFRDVLFVVGPVIEENMAQTSADDGGDHRVNEQIIQDFSLNAFFCEIPAHEVKTEQKAREEKHLVIAQEERAEFQSAFRGPRDG